MRLTTPQPIRHTMNLVDIIAQGFGIALIIVTIHTIITSRK